VRVQSAAIRPVEPRHESALVLVRLGDETGDGKFLELKD